MCFLPLILEADDQKRLCNDSFRSLRQFSVLCASYYCYLPRSLLSLLVCMMCIVCWQLLRVRLCLCLCDPTNSPNSPLCHRRLAGIEVIKVEDTHGP